MRLLVVLNTCNLFNINRLKNKFFGLILFRSCISEVSFFPVKFQLFILALEKFSHYDKLFDGNKFIFVSNSTSYNSGVKLVQ